MLGGREFESRHRILDRSIFTFICCEIVLMFEKNKNKQKEAGNGPFYAFFIQ